MRRSDSARGATSALLAQLTLGHVVSWVDAEDFSEATDLTGVAVVSAAKPTDIPDQQER
jgi:hypothetical protein